MRNNKEILGIIVIIIVITLVLLLVFSFRNVILEIHNGPEALLSSFPYISAFLVALLAFVLGNWAWDFIRRPKLEIEDMDQEETEAISSYYAFAPHSTRVKYLDEEDKLWGNPEDFDVTVHNLRVINGGRTTAKNVRAYLKIDQKRFDGEKFLLKWKSRPDPPVFKYYDGKELKEESNLGALSDDRMSIDLFPGKQNSELLSVTLRRPIWLEEYIKEIRRIEPVHYDVLLVYSPVFYYGSEFGRILLSQVAIGPNIRTRKDDLNDNINARMSGSLTIAYEGLPISYDIILENVSVLSGKPVKVILKRHRWFKIS